MSVTTMKVGCEWTALEPQGDCREDWRADNLRGWLQKLHSQSKGEDTASQRKQCCQGTAWILLDMTPISLQIHFGAFETSKQKIIYNS